MSFWRKSKSSALEAKHYSMHGPQSTITLCPISQRMSYSANFSAQTPESIADRIQADYRFSPDTEMLNYFSKLSVRLSKAEE
ncbi:hypothetical protein [Zhongshania borealis]|jgi:hypothetical protein|uniref:Uncharacterized protein n=1 Tax=Zhongshania borealis TaxID=889488 RepID=A0ABP7WBJ6_9GAMM|tara:strand:+ start:4014 stop:4259 length:246 start_codon:yes stop_codon:yes gene_type:complete